MLGIRLSPQDEERLERHARESGRPKCALARDWIIQRLEQESIDRKIADAASLFAAERDDAVRQTWDDATDAWLRALDAEDGGYEWGPDGPPDSK